MATATATVVTTIDLIRHGEPVGGRRYRGQVDDPLSEKGWAQMRRAVGEHRPWQKIISSPLLRCREFASELSQRHQLPLLLEDRFMEIGFGAWEGKTADELRRDDPAIIQRFIMDPVTNRPQGAELLTAFRDRVIGAWEETLQSASGQHVLIVAHAGVMRMVLRHVLDMPLERIFRITVGNAALTRIRIDDHGTHRWPNLIFHDGSL